MRIHEVTGKMQGWINRSREVIFNNSLIIIFFALDRDICKFIHNAHIAAPSMFANLGYPSTWDLKTFLSILFFSLNEAR